MRDTLAVVALVGVFFGSMVWAAVTEMFKAEVRTRLDGLPYMLIRLAARRIPRTDRNDLTDEWQAELDFVLHGTEGLPLTRLLRGVLFSADLLLRGAAGVAREIKAAKTRPNWRLAVRARLSRLPTWASLYPEGRDIFYEGDHPAGFASQIEAEFGFSPALDPRWGVSYCFYCPAEHLDAIYGSDRFPVGS